jgi:hypothetical protein
MNPNELIPKIQKALASLRREGPNDPSEAYALLKEMLGDAQHWRDLEDWGGSNRRGQTSTPMRADYPKDEPQPEKN